VVVQLSDLSSRLQELRLRAGLTQRALCARLDLAPATVANVEANRRRPSIELLFAWIEATGGNLRVELPGEAESPLLALTAEERALVLAYRALVPDRDPLDRRRRAVLVALARGLHNAGTEGVELLEMHAERLSRAGSSSQTDAAPTQEARRRAEGA
jgi:transcriptional regulator with XRE-family HTH domain